MSEISPSALGEKLSNDFQSKLAACTDPEQIKELCHSEELSRGLIKLDWDESFRIAVETPQPTGFAKTVTVNGVKHIIEGASESEVAQAELALYHQLFQPAAAGTEPQPRDPSTGKFRAAADQDRSVVVADPALEAARQAELRAQMVRGEISVDEFMLQSGALNRVLAAENIDVNALREITAQKYEQNWATATQEFLASSDWPGGEINRQRLGETLISMGATEKPSVDNLRRAYQILKDKNMIAETVEAIQAQKISAARTPEELRDAIGYRGNTALWGK
jgi:hypothetical protein